MKEHLKLVILSFAIPALVIVVAKILATIGTSGESFFLLCISGVIAGNYIDAKTAQLDTFRRAYLWVLPLTAISVLGILVAMWALFGNGALLEIRERPVSIFLLISMSICFSGGLAFTPYFKHDMGLS